MPAMGSSSSRPIWRSRLAPVEVDALVDDAVPVEAEDGDHRHPEGTTRRRQAEEVALVGAEQVELGDDGVVVGDVHPDVLVALVGKRRALGPVVGDHGVTTLVDLSGGHDLVAGHVPEGGQAGLPVVVDLRLEVLLEHGEPPAPELLVDHGASSSSMCGLVRR